VTAFVRRRIEAGDAPFAATLDELGGDDRSDDDTSGGKQGAFARALS